VIQRSVKQGFYDISLVVSDSSFLREDIFYTGVSNIQLDIENVSLDFIQAGCEFSKKYGPQFRIDFDIFVRSYSAENIEKIKMLLRFLPSDFVKIYFLYDYKGKEIFSYIPLLEKLHSLKENIYTIHFYPKLLFKTENGA